MNLPQIAYQPRDPQEYRPRIGLIGCGGITEYHLQAYRSAGYEVAALCDVNLDAAEKRREEYYPEARVSTDHRQLLENDAIEVVDITTHPDVRPPLIEDALRAGKHVLSQKPFVLDLEVGQRLADLADQEGVLLAVNQNGRWAPHFSYIREVVRSGLIGEVVGVHCSVHWNHHWIVDTPFNEVRDLILYDFAIHWFDFLTTILGEQRATRVYGSTARTSQQTAKPALLGQALIEYPHAQATLVFDGNVPQGEWDQLTVSGTKGIIRSFGKDTNNQSIELISDEGTWSPRLEGKWFPDGFHGTMGELLLAIEENREPAHSARNNLRSLELCFAAVASSLSQVAVEPGTIRQLPEDSN